MYRRATSIFWAVAAVPFGLLTMSLPSAETQSRFLAAAQTPPTNAQCIIHLSHPCLAPALIRRYYDLDPLLQRGITGRGRSIVLVESFGSPTLQTDLHVFDKAFGLPDPRLSILTPLGPNQPTTENEFAGWATETTEDVEWAHVMAPGANLVVLVSPVNETEGVQGLPQFLQLERYALDHHLGDVISQSWGATEDTLLDGPGRAMVAQFHRFYLQATSRGVTVTACSGDYGADGLDSTAQHLAPGNVVQFPAADPLVLGVGGTTLTLSSADGTVADESAWSLSGGGRSKIFAEPTYQRTLPQAAETWLHGKRGVPDVAFDGDWTSSSVLFYNQGAWGVTGGTSLGAAVWAGIIALADQAAGRDLGSVNAALYRIAASSAYGTDFYDTVQGGNYTFPSNTTGPSRLANSAVIGWDAATGLGTPRIANLVSDLTGMKH